MRTVSVLMGVFLIVGGPWSSKAEPKKVKAAPHAAEMAIQQEQAVGQFSVPIPKVAPNESVTSVVVTYARDQVPVFEPEIKKLQQQGLGYLPQALRSCLGEKWGEGSIEIQFKGAAAPFDFLAVKLTPNFETKRFCLNTEIRLAAKAAKRVAPAKLTSSAPKAAPVRATEAPRPR